MASNFNDDKPIDLRPDAPSGAPERASHGRPPNDNGPQRPYSGYRPHSERPPKPQWPIFLLIAVILLFPVLLVGVGVAAFSVARSSTEVSTGLSEAVVSVSDYAADFRYEHSAAAVSEEAFANGNEIFYAVYPIGDVKKLSFDLAASNVDFVQTDGANLTVHWYTEGATAEDIGASVSLSDGTLSVKEEDKDFLALDFETRSWIEIAVPFIMMDEINIDTVNGSVYFNNDVITGEFKAASVTGEISLWNLNASGNVSIDQTSGGFSCGNLTAQDFQYHSVNGTLYADSIICQKMNLDTVSAYLSPGTVSADEIISNSVSGDVEFISVTAEKLTADTVIGMILLQQPAINEMKLTTVSGQIEIYEPVYKNIEAETVTSDMTVTSSDGQPVDVRGETLMGELNNDLAQSEDAERTIVFNSSSGSAYIQ